MRVSVQAVHRLRAPQAGHGVRGGPRVAHVALKQKRRVLVWTLGGRKLVLRAGHERLPPVQRGELVLFVAARVAVFTVLSAKTQQQVRFAPVYIFCLDLAQISARLRVNRATLGLHQEQNAPFQLFLIIFFQLKQRFDFVS